MTAVAYGMTDVAPSRDGLTPPGAVAVSPAQGGCGSSHEVGVNEDGRPVITCPTCAPILIASHYGWSATPGGVPLTPDETAARELAKRDAEAGQNQLLTAVVADFLKRNGPGAQVPVRAAEERTLADTLKGVSAEDLLAALPPELTDALAAAAAAKEQAPPKHAAAKAGTSRARAAR
jgi:hypothetical protein